MKTFVLVTMLFVAVSGNAIAKDTGCESRDIETRFEIQRADGSISTIVSKNGVMRTVEGVDRERLSRDMKEVAREEASNFKEFTKKEVGEFKEALSWVKEQVASVF